MFVKLQRPPPEMRIFLPMRSACSRTATRRPRLPASIAHINPAAPAPRIMASKVWGDGLGKSSLEPTGAVILKEWLDIVQWEQRINILRQTYSRYTSPSH